MNIMDSSSMVSFKGLAFLNQISTPMRGNSKMESIMGKASIHGLRDQFMKDNTKKDKSMASEYTKKQMGQDMKVAGLTENVMGKVTK